MGSAECIKFHQLSRPHTIESLASAAIVGCEIRLSENYRIYFSSEISSSSSTKEKLTPKLWYSRRRSHQLILQFF
jgi:hypothetical protein